MKKPVHEMPATAVVRHEQSHRRALLLALAILLLLSTSGLFGHHLPLGLDRYLAGRDHIWALCLVALHLIMAPVHGLFHLLFAVGLGYAVLDRVRAFYAKRAVLHSLESREPAPGSGFWIAAERVGLSASQIRVVEGLPTPAFTSGWIHPRVYLAASLADRLPPSALEAVIAHEAAHVQRRDPLRFSLLRFLACMLFWLPAIGRLADDIADEAEVHADDHAARGQPLALASAILILSQWVRAERASHHGVGFDDRDLLERRVRRLAGEHVMPRSRLTLLPALTAAIALSLTIMSGAIIAHPLPANSPNHQAHCEHSGPAVLFHLLGGVVLEASPAECIHSTDSSRRA